MLNEKNENALKHF